MKKIHFQKGVSIIEVLVALLVLSIGMGGYWYGLRELTRNDFTELKRQAAVQLAFSEMERARVLSPETIGDSIYQWESESQGPFEVRRQVARADSVFNENWGGLNPLSENSLKHFPIEIRIQVWEPMEDRLEKTDPQPLAQLILKKPGYQWY